MASKNTVSGDDRFSKVQKDPRFWEMPSRERKVKIDKRFKSMFHDERFKLKYTVDKRGRPVNQTSTEDLKRFYKLSDSEQSDEEEENEQTEKPKKEQKVKKADEEPQVEDEEESDESEEEEEAEKNPKTKEAKKTKEPLVKGVRVFEEDEDEESGVEEDEEEEADEDDESESGDDSDNGPDLARGKGNIETSSDEDDDDDDDDELEECLRHEEEEIEHDWGEMWKDAPRSDNTSRRLAVCNMNWDRLKAKDLLALFSSFKPKGGVVLSVTIYPSELGKERMSAEQTQGPLELAGLPEDPDADTDEQRVYREKVRDYQFKRLRYYYGVVECDSVETAAKIYAECDGYEYESSCSMIDLRFIPDDVTFDDEPKDRATDVDYSSYKPKLFTSTATTTAKVELTWDETDHDRVTALCRKFNKDDLLDMDFKAYLASSSEEEEDEEEAEQQAEAEPLPEEKKSSKEKKSTEQIAKYRELLKSFQDKDKEKDDSMDMEVNKIRGLKKTTEKLVKKKMEGKDQLTPWEQYLQKRKEKKKEKRKGKKEAAEAEPGISDDELPADVELLKSFQDKDILSAASLKNKKNRKKDEEKTPEEQEELERRRAEMELLMDDEEDNKHKHFNYAKIVEQQNLSKKKRKKLLKSNTPLEEDDFQVDVQDSRFQAMFTSHLYNLDPSDPAYKKTKATQSILEEKQRRREERQHSQEEAQEKDGAEAPSSSTKVMDPSLSLLVRSIKNKTEQFQVRKKQKTK
ncbi:ESF1 homolog [Sinocyclocheilus anshuiensis]|uniref:ESF1 homolog n=1 Tax=Sinocyclocheilus anshuiensis TaxID=1608454 RepID=UPI0007B859A3|nr:PREDICTED: ESF1 homolog [Sinocyclocheilus anshuiensis]